jgi:hypothetical protein
MPSNAPSPKTFLPAVVLAGALVALLVVVVPSASAGNLAPSSGALFGASVPGGQSGVTSFESLIGRKLRIDHRFWGWSDSWPTSTYESWDVKNGRIPMVSWDGPNTTLSNIINGSQDSVIRSRANAVKSFGSQILIRWGYEMNGTWFAWGGANNGKDPSKFVAAWKHIVDLFRSVGATNALWVWAPNVGDNPKESWNHWTNYYPGDSYVDWVGIDGYNWGSTQTWSSWQSFGQVFGGSPSIYNDYKGRKPIMVAESGTVEQGGDKGAWWRDVLNQLKTNFTGVKAVVWLNDIHNGYDWRAQTSSNSLDGYRTMVHDSWLNGGSSTSVATAPTNSGLPTISGTPAQGQTLTASTGSWSGSPTSYAYRWQRCGADYAQSILGMSPVGYWRFGESGGTLANDSSTANADGSYVSAILGQPGAVSGNTSALFQGGSHARATFGDRFDFSGTAPFSLEAWVKPSALDGYYRRLFSKEATDSYGREGYLVWLSTKGIGFERWSKNWPTRISSSTPLTIGKWSHVVATYDGSFLRLYVDGKMVASGGSTLSLLGSSAPFSVSGASGASDFLTAAVDEVAVYGKALGSTTVAQHYGNASGGGCSDISGATSRSYGVGSADVGHTLRVAVTATSSAGSATAYSGQTGVVK